MFGLGEKSKRKRLQKQYEKLLSDAMSAQRNGDIKTYSMLTSQAEALRSELEAMEQVAE